MSLRTIIVRIVAFPAVRFALVAGALTAALPRPAVAQTFTPCASTDACAAVMPAYEPGHLDFLPGLSECLGTFVFHSPFPPGPIERWENAIAIKHGSGSC
jgi:hypothetical protein